MTVIDSERLEPQLEGVGICLRPFTEVDDSETFVYWLNDPLVMKCNKFFLPHTREPCLDYLRSFTGTDNLYFAIEDYEAGSLHGSITIYCRIHHGTANIGIMVGNRQAWGRGIGYKVWYLLLDYLSTAVTCGRLQVATCTMSSC